MNKFRLYAMGFMIIAIVGLSLISTMHQIIGFIVLGIGALPATACIIKARMEEA